MLKLRRVQAVRKVVNILGEVPQLSKSIFQLSSNRVPAFRIIFQNVKAHSQQGQPLSNVIVQFSCEVLAFLFCDIDQPTRKIYRASGRSGGHRDGGSFL